jgi:hypothetical protein
MPIGGTTIVLHRLGWILGGLAPTPEINKTVGLIITRENKATGFFTAYVLVPNGPRSKYITNRDTVAMRAP